MNAGLSFEISLIRPCTAELAAFDRLIMGEAPSCLIESSSFLLETRACIKVWMTSNINQIRPLTTDLTVLEHLKNRCIVML